MKETKAQLIDRYQQEQRLAIANDMHALARKIKKDLKQLKNKKEVK